MYKRQGCVWLVRENGDSRVLHGQDFYIRTGTVPNTFRESYLNSLSFPIGREGAVNYAFGCVGKRPQETYYVDGTRTQGTITYPIADQETFTGWQAGIFYVDGTTTRRLAALDATVTITNNIAFSPVLSGVRTPGGTFRGRRNITFEGTMEYKEEDSALIDGVLGNQFLENAYLELVNATTGGVPRKVRYSFGRLQFANLPSAPVTDEGIIARPMSMRALRSADGSVPDLQIRVETLTPLALAAITP